MLVLEHTGDEGGERRVGGVTVEAGARSELWRDLTPLPTRGQRSVAHMRSRRAMKCEIKRDDPEKALRLIQNGFLRSWTILQQAAGG